MSPALKGYSCTFPCLSQSPGKKLHSLECFARFSELEIVIADCTRSLLRLSDILDLFFSWCICPVDTLVFADRFKAPLSPTDESCNMFGCLNPA